MVFAEWLAATEVPLSDILGAMGVSIDDATTLLQYKTILKTEVHQNARFLPNYFSELVPGLAERLTRVLGEGEVAWLAALSCGFLGFALSLFVLRISRSAEELLVPSAEEAVAVAVKPMLPPAAGSAEEGKAAPKVLKSEDKGLFQSLRNASIWLGFSCALTVQNAWIFKSGFPHVFCLTCFHLTLCTTLGLSIFIFKREWMTRLPSNPLEVLAGVAMPALLGTGGIVCGNMSYLYLPVHTVQTSKALVPLLTFSLSCFCGLEKWSWQLLSSLAVVIIGTVVNVASEAAFTDNGWAGVVMVTALILECARLVSLKYMLSSGGHGLDPLSGLLFYAPLQLCCLLPLAAFEFHKVDTSAAANMVPALALNGALAVGLNLAMLFLLQGVSSTTHATLGSLRDVFVVVVAAVVLKNCPQPRQSFGMGLVLGGVYVYNRLKAMTPAKK